MVSRRGCLALAAVASAAVAACGGPVYSYRYRLTVEVDTPGGPKSGSSVIETTVQDDSKAWWGPIEGRLVRSRNKGEAVFVDLGQGRNVVALMGRETAGVDGPILRSLVPTLLGIREVEGLRTVPERKGQSAVPYHLLPTFVTFSDPNEPKSVQIVRPDEFETVFGPGVRFRRAWVEITSNSVTRQIQKQLPEVLRLLREDDKVMQIKRLGDPFRVNSGHLSQGF